MGKTALARTRAGAGLSTITMSRLRCIFFYVISQNSGRKIRLPLDGPQLPPPPPFAFPQRCVKAPSEDKAVIQPGPNDIPTVRVQLGQLMNSARVPGGSQPCSLAHKRLLFAFLFFSKCLDVLRAQKRPKPRPSARASLMQGSLGARALGTPTLSSVVPTFL